MLYSNQIIQPGYQKVNKKRTRLCKSRCAQALEKL